MVTLTVRPRLRLTVAFFFFNDTATTEIYTLSLHDALPISCSSANGTPVSSVSSVELCRFIPCWATQTAVARVPAPHRSEEHTSELQSRQYLVCRLLLEKKKKKKTAPTNY